MQHCPSCFEASETGSTCETCRARLRDATALPVGATLRAGRYAVGRTLGSPGGFGITYLAWDNSLARRVAIKEYYPRQGTVRSTNGVDACPQSAADAVEFSAGLAGFLDEARRLAQLDHQNIVKVLDYCEANGTGYLVMSYYEGRDLAEYALSLGGKLEWREVFELTAPLLDGLSDVHAAGLIHRDVKPANIYLARVGASKTRSILIDFGAARWASTTHELTSILTEGFAPIEQYPGCGLQGPWTDIYAVAATIYALITGSVPASAPSRMAGNYLPNLSEVGRGVPRRFADVVEDGLSVQVDTRPQSASEFARALRNAVESLTGGTARDVRSHTTTPMTGSAASPPVIESGSVQPTRRIAPVPLGQPKPKTPTLAGIALPAIVISVLAGVGGLLWLAVGGRPSETAANQTTANAPEVVRLPKQIPLSARSDDPEIVALLDTASVALAHARYGTSMSVLQRAHEAAAAEPASAPGRSALLQRVDSLAARVDGACRAESEILASRGEKPAPCRERGW